MDPNWDPNWDPNDMIFQAETRNSAQAIHQLSSIPELELFAVLRCPPVNNGEKPVARQIGHGPLKAGPLRQRKGQDHVLNFAKNIMKYHVRKMTLH